MLKTLTIAVAVLATITGCASNVTEPARKLEPTTVALISPIYLVKTDRGARHRLHEISSATGWDFGNYKAARGVVWLEVSQSTGVLSTKKSWFNVQDLDSIAGVTSERNAKDKRSIGQPSYILVLTKEQVAIGNKHYTEYDQPRLFLCEPGAHPSSAAKVQCFQLTELNGTYFTDRFDQYDGGPVMLTAAQILDMRDPAAVRGITADAYAARHKLVKNEVERFAQNDKDTALVRLEQDKRQKEQQDKLFISAKRGTEASCTTGRDLRPSTEPIAEMFFECGNLGPRSFLALRRAGWGMTHSERIPTSSWNGVQGVTVNILVRKN